VNRVNSASRVRFRPPAGRLEGGSWHADQALAPLADEPPPDLRRDSSLAVRPSSGALAHYDPERGVKTIAVLDGIVRHYAQAKDATKLKAAIRAKLEAQAEFVVWWDTQAEKVQGARGERGPGRGYRGKRRSRSATPFLAGQNGLPDRYTIARWRAKLADPEQFEATYEAALARYVAILELETMAHVGRNTGAQEWYTPPAIVEAARSVLGAIDLDPASTPEAIG
jgi:hypothetical protein